MTDNLTTKHPETLALHAGFRADPTSGSVAVPIHQTTAYHFEDAACAESLFALKGEGDFYTRISNPTVRVLEKRVAAIEGGSAAVCVASGQAASATSIQNLASAGDNIVAASNLYGGTTTLLRFTLEHQGIEVRFVDPLNPENFPNASDERTRCWFGESLPNPNLLPFPIAEVAELGLQLDIPLIIDNTCAPLICRPFDHGAAIIVYSLTKYFCGSGSSLGGCVIDGGGFNWKRHAARQPNLSTPEASYHNIIWNDAYSPEVDISPYIQRLRFCLLRDIGCSLSPLNAFMILQGTESLALRMPRHTENAHAVAYYLNQHPLIESILHPSLFVGVHGERAEVYLKNRGSGLIGVNLKGDISIGHTFLNHLKLFYHVSNIGDTRSLAVIPAQTINAQIDNPKPPQNTTFIRLSIGIEHIDDILADLEQALNAAEKNRKNLI